ncbi:sodium-coupled monocarboxylate transporter 1 isoform X5 [Stomoxys calcitrans]|uniref:sodium-coupled monocarboxylate transporter 1 isoform X5 n=1 Tax=Stomoxys calcitrans TaxID=35570 RepID=UPI0027E33FB6|nr:sodium-coupled monocarboxylate transporter 1 isoform X5 [Stomoxys calcitrans]
MSSNTAGIMAVASSTVATPTTTTAATATNAGGQQPIMEMFTTTMASIKETMRTLITNPTTTSTITTTTSTATTTTTSTAAFLPSTSKASISVSSSAQPDQLNVADLSSSLQHFGWVDYCVFVLMLIICAFIGFYFGFIEKKQKNQKRSATEHRRGSEALDYLVGGRKMKVFPVSLSLVASFVSGISLLGTSTEIYVYGTQYAFILITLALSGVISWYVFLPVFCNLQLTSTYEYFERRFSRRMRLFGAVLFNVKTLLWLPIAVYVPALTLSQVSGLNLHTIAPMVIIICTFYTTVGGIRGVVWTDVIQSFVMFGSIILLIIKGTIDIGGFGVLWQRNWEGGRLKFPELTLDPTVRMGILPVFVGGTFFKLQNTSINQPTIQRFMSLPSLKKIKQTLWTFSIGLTLLYSLCIYVGLLAYATFYDCDPMATGLAHSRDQLVPVLVMNVLGQFPGMPGIFVSGVFSAALSSLSTYLNSLAAVVLEDFIRPFCKEEISERTTAIVMRSVVVICGLSSIGLVYVVEQLGMVLQLSATLQSIVYGPMLGIFTVGMLMPWLNEKSVLSGSIVSFLCMAWICINAQIANVTGAFRHSKLPVSVEGCDYEFDMTKYLNSTSEYLPSQGSSIYHVSFLLYTGLGAVLVMLASNVASLFFGLNDISKLDGKLLAPFMAKLMKKYQYAEVKERENFVLK